MMLQPGDIVREKNKAYYRITGLDTRFSDPKHSYYNKFALALRIADSRGNPIKRKSEDRLYVDHVDLLTPNDIHQLFEKQLKQAETLRDHLLAQHGKKP